MFDGRLIHNAMIRSAASREDRRRFLRNAGGLSVGLLGGMVLGACDDDGSSAMAQDMDGASTEGDQVSDADILNFALNLEYLESEFYLRAIGSSLQDRGIGVDGTGTMGPVVGGAAVPFQTPAIQQYAREIAGDESAHVQFLRTALDAAGAQPVARPRINISGDANGAFTLAARAAGLRGPDETFDPYANEVNFMLAAFIFEDVGVTAFKGAAPLIQDAQILEAAAGILAAEAYHAGLIRTVLYNLGIQNPSAMLHEATVAISDARDSLDGSDDIDQGIVVVGDDGSIQTATAAGQEVNQANIVLLDQNGLAFSRSAGQALNVVYLTAEQATMGGFFPQGVNGAINTSSAAGNAG